MDFTFKLLIILLFVICPTVKSEKLSAYVPSKEYILSLKFPSPILTCYGRGYPRPNITWTKNGLPVSFIQTDNSINKILIKSQLNLGDVTYEKAGNYTCHVENGVNGQYPISVVIEVLVQPVIIVVPTKKNKIEGSDVIFRCESSGVPVPTINWLFNGASIPWRHTIDRRGFLILKNVTHGTHDGRYTCMAANKAGKVSHSARLTVYIGASAQANKRRHVFSLNSENAILTCYGRGYPFPKITWTNGSPVSFTQTDIVINKTFVESKINLGNFTQEKAGNYSCYARNWLPDGAYIPKPRGMVIEALLHPIILEEPSDQDTMEGSNVILKCKASGVPQPTNTWLFNGKSIKFDHSIDKGSLVIENVAHETHAGKYTCVASSKAGTVSHSAWLFIAVRPSFVVRPSSKSALEGTGVIFRCKATGVPTPIITWLFNNQPITWQHSVRGGRLSNWNVRYGTHDGRYTCAASNRAGKISTSARLTVYKACPSGWSEGPRSCYRIVTTPTAKWDDARKSCISMGGYLVKINSNEENRFVTNLASKSSSKQYMWIGLSRTSRGGFSWTDGTSLSGGYSNWDNGEPNNYSGKENCAYLYVRGRKEFSWNDHDCNYEGRPPFFTCERRKRN